MADQIHNKENCWRTKDGEYIPYSEMTNSHLRNAKHFAQGKVEYFYHKLCELDMIVEALENEAEKRNIVLKDRKSKFQRSKRILEHAIAKTTPIQ